MMDISLLPLRFQRKIKLNTESDCWEWTGYIGGTYGHKNNLPYGRVYYLGKAQSAHRVVYQLLKGDIDKHMVVDHLCRNTICVNPQHLEQVTYRKNNKRAIRTPKSLITNAPRKGYKNNCLMGISWASNCNKWRAYISYGGVFKHLGVYEDLQDAVNARLIAEVDLGLF